MCEDDVVVVPFPIPQGAGVASFGLFGQPWSADAGIASVHLLPMLTW